MGNSFGGILKRPSGLRCPSFKHWRNMNREAQDAKLHINSFSTDSETPIIRSHRPPAGKVTTRRVLACVLALAVSSGGMAVANAAVDPKGALAPIQVVVTAPLVAIEQAPREELVSRSAARKAS